MKQLLALLAVAGAVFAVTAPAAAAGDAERGRELFERLRCKACHTVNEGGRNRPGPNLHRVFGSTAAQRNYEFKNYSAAMKSSGVVWDEETLDRFLANPRGFLPGTRMSYVGVNRPDDRADLIAYLKTLE